MPIKSVEHRWKRFCVSVMLGTLMTTIVHAQEVEDPDTWQDNLGIDLSLGALHLPVLQPVWFTPLEIRRMPTGSPLYKQQPPSAQDDFRVVVDPVVTVTPVEAPKPSPKPVPVVNSEATTNTTPDPAVSSPPPAPPPPSPPDPDPCGVFTCIPTS